MKKMRLVVVVLLMVAGVAGTAHAASFELTQADRLIWTKVVNRDAPIRIWDPPIGKV